MAERDRDVVRFSRSSRAGARAGHPERAIPLRSAWTAGPVRGAWTSGAAARRRAGARSPREEYFDVEGLAGRLRLRQGDANEWFTPFGRTRRVRLGRFLQKQPVSRDQRSHPIVLADDGGILWVVGVRRGARAPLTAATRRALRVHVETSA
jgi:hypothetical protein